MKKLLLCITIILCVCTYGWTAGVPFTGSIDAEDVDYPNTKSISGNPTNVKTAIDGLKTEIGNISAGTLADIDDLPGDEVDDNKIDSSLINNAVADGSTKGVCTFSASHFSAANGVISLNTTLDLSAFTINFGLEDADIPASIARDSELPTATSLHLDDVLTALGIASEAVHFGTFTGDTIDDNLTAKAIFQALETAIESIEVGEPTITGTLAAVEDTSGVTANQYWGSDANSIMGYHDLPEGGSFVIDSLSENETTTGIDAYTMPIDNSGTSYKMTWENIISAIRASLGLGEATDGENYIEVSNNTSREPDADVNQLYPEGNVWKMNSNGVEDTIVGAADLPAIATSIGLEKTINIYDNEVLVGQMNAVTDGEGVSQLTLRALMGSTMTDFFTPCGNCGVTHFWKPIDLPASTASKAPLNISSGTAPSSPAEGDIYYDGTHLYFKPSGSAVDLLQTMVYPGAGVPVSTGSAWGTSLTVGTEASNLVQLDESGKLPAVDGSSLTGLFDPASPGAIGGTTPAAATFTTLGAGAGGFSVDADGDVTAKSLSITRVTGQASYSEYFEVPANGDNKVTVKPADSLAASAPVVRPQAVASPFARRVFRKRQWFQGVR